MISIVQYCDKCKNVTSHTLDKGVILCLKCKKQMKLKNDTQRPTTS